MLRILMDLPAKAMFLHARQSKKNVLAFHTRRGILKNLITICGYQLPIHDYTPQPHTRSFLLVYKMRNDGAA